MILRGYEQLFPQSTREMMVLEKLNLYRLSARLVFSKVVPEN